MKTALAVAGFNRPQYFKPCVEALAANDLSTVDCFAFLDGGSRATPTDYLALIKTYLPKCELHLRDHNFGCGRHMIALREYLFNERGYDRVLVVEDDTVVSSNYIKFMHNLADFADTQPGVGVVSGFSPILLEAHEKPALAANVFLGDANWISYLMPKRTWDLISQDMLEYADTFLRGDYHNRDHKAIRAWVAKKLESRTFGSCGEIPKFALDFWARQTDKFLLGTGATGQDGTTCAMLVRHGLAKMCTQVNRCIHIGVFGQHSRPHHAGTKELARQRLDELKNDDALTQFNWWKHPS